VSQALLDLLAALDQLGTPGRQVVLAWLERAAELVRLDLQDLLVLLVQWVLQEGRELLVHLALPERLEHPVQLAVLEHQEQRAPLGRRDRLDQTVQQEHLDQLVDPDPPGQRGRREVRVPLEL